VLFRSSIVVSFVSLNFDATLADTFYDLNNSSFIKKGLINSTADIIGGLRERSR
jgi:hypothetical protein